MAGQFDAIVIGGGPGGATAALMLARAGWKVAVVERARFPRRKVCGEYLSATNFPLLRRLGVAEAIGELAGPPVRQVGLFARETTLAAPMPRAGAADWGRALGRERLDTLLLDRAARSGAQVWQPWSAIRLRKQGDMFLCETTDKAARLTNELRTKIVIAAHGSWEPGTLPTQPGRRAPRSADLLGFKARFRDCALPVGLMPLLVFPGGYGGLVHTDDGRVSLSCCIRRDRLERSRRATPHVSAAEAVLAHIKQSCRAAGDALAGARLDGAWLSAGPIRPGIRSPFAGGVYFVGNAAGEAHPIIAEGISMAMQSAWMLCERLLARQSDPCSTEALREIGRDYSMAWRNSFVARIRAATLFARVAMQPAAVKLLLPLFRLVPASLTLGARWSGKADEVPLGPFTVGRPAG